MYDFVLQESAGQTHHHWVGKFLLVEASKKGKKVLWPIFNLGWTELSSPPMAGGETIIPTGTAWKMPGPLQPVAYHQWRFGTKSCVVFYSHRICLTATLSPASYWVEKYDEPLKLTTRTSRTELTWQRHLKLNPNGRPLAKAHPLAACWSALDDRRGGSVVFRSPAKPLSLQQL